MNPEGQPNPPPATHETVDRVRSGVYLGKYRGIRFYLDYSWFIIAALLVYTLSSLLFPTELPGRPPAVYISMGIIAAALFFFSIVLHELGHSIVSQRCGIPVPAITLLFIGGLAEISREPDDARSELKIAIAGPAVSLVLVVVFGVLGLGANTIGFPEAAFLLFWLAQVNLILIVFNAIPGYPLDGGRVLRALLWMRNGKLRQATYITSRIGIGFSMFLIVLGIFLLFAFGAWNGLIFILIGVFLRSAAESGYSQTVYKEVLEGVRVGDLMTKDPLTIPARTPLNLAVDDYFLTNHHVAFPVVQEDGRYSGLLRLEYLKDVPREKWPYLTVEDLVIQKGADSFRVTAETSAANTLRTLLLTGQGRLGVVDGENRLIGIITRHDLLHFIRIHTELDVS